MAEEEIGEFKGMRHFTNGKVYRSKVHLVDGGKKLSVRGYIGISVLGRTQTWLRDIFR